MTSKAVWLVGRGVSVSCGLTWDVPPALYEQFKSGALRREALVERVRRELRAEQAEALKQGCLDLTPLEALLGALYRANRSSEWQHAFVTTNWDTLLDRALSLHGKPGREDVRTAAWHLNGSIDRQEPLLTEADRPEDRDAAVESTAGFRELVGAKLCIAVGLSLRSAPDRELISRLGRNQRWLPAGEDWIVVNHDAGEIARVSHLLERQLPRSRVTAVRTPFDRWVAEGMPELRRLGVLA